MVSLFTFLPDYATDKVEPQIAPRVAVGAASPLWLMFGGAAAAGAAYWWWASRWREAVNLEALMALAPEPVAPAAAAEATLAAAPQPIVEPILEPVVEAVAETVEIVMNGEEAALALTAEAIVELVADTAEAAVTVIPEPAADAVAASAADVAAEAPEAAADDLTRLVGVGPKLAASLADLGVTRFSQIALWSPDDLASIDQLLNLKGRAERDAWVAQAKRFVGSPDA